MKCTWLFLFSFCCGMVKGQASTENQMDAALAKKITIAGFCLCHTTLQDLQNLGADFMQTAVEEMDMGKRCISEDSRYIYGKGYYSQKYPGLIFQKDRDEDYISKIRLTKDFTGNLPDGTPVSLQNLLLKDILKKYPGLNSKWGSRDCSDYWNFSNDTISFYVRIDENKMPRFPIDEPYYLDKPIAGIDIMMSCYSVFHRSEKLILFPENEPVYFLDSIRVNKGVLNMYKPEEMALISVYKGADALKLAGKEAKNGVIYLTTKEFARNAYWNYFKSKSPEYKKAVPDITTEAHVAYILDGKPLQSNFEADLFNINDSNFVKLTLVDKENLKKDYHISGKLFGVVIETTKK